MMKWHWAWFIGLSGVALGCEVDSAPGTTAPPARALIDALMEHVHIKGALLKSGDLLDPTDGADTVKLATPNGTLQLRPRASSLMPLEVDHPDREPKVRSTLMQFDGSDDHFEVPISEPGDAVRTLSLEHEFGVDEEICDGLCNQRYAATLIVAMQLEGGEITVHHRVEIVLDCRARGDEAYCDGAPPPAQDDAGMDGSTGLPRIDAGTGADAAPEDGATAMPDAQGIDSGTLADAGMDAALEDGATEDGSQPLPDGAPPADAGPVEPPQITSKSPEIANAQSAITLTIDGTGFASGAVAYLDSQELDTLSVNETTLVADVPSTLTRAGSLAIWVENAPGNVTSRSNVLYLTVNPPAGAPTVYDYSPDNGLPGDTVLIIASNLNGHTITIEDAEGTVLTPGTLSTISWPAPGTVDTVEIVLPDGIATGPITVANELGSYRGKIFNVGSNLTRLEGTVIESSTQYNDAQWGRASGADNQLATSFFTAVGDCATSTSCTTVPWFKITFPSPQTVARIAMRGNREYYSGYDFIRGRFEVLGDGDVVLFEGDYDLPLPDRDLDIVLAEPIDGAAAVRFSSLEDESSDPGFAELEVFGP